MFEAITISIQNKNELTEPIDIGSLVECMLFYNKVSVVANQAILKQLINYFGFDRLIELIEEELLELLYTDTFVGIITNTQNNTQFHDAAEYSSPNHTFFDQINRVCTEVSGKSGKGRRLANRIRDRIHLTKNDTIILEGTRESILDQDYVGNAAKEIIKELVPGVENISEIKFNTFKESEGIVVETNLNFTVLNELYHKRVSPKHSSLSNAYILAHLLDAERELYFSSSRLSELSSSTLSSKIIGHKINYILARSNKSKELLSNFNSFFFNNNKALREEVNAKRIDLDELMKVLKNSGKFKKWLVGIAPDEDLLKKYYQEVTKKTIVDKLPGKSTRWLIFTGLGILSDVIATGGLATIGGLTLSALDTFIVDKIISGWKPNQYIEEEIKNLIKLGL
ncbi:MAG: hypothetical protein FD122_3521 [Stygiobacter sp.]|nr:MAG: hypothetical protein FD122_3521 [Stygiobacter sp.]KAF0214876.1 MAG: hypothetical protein FD178_2109 [Ignavibacteria bacterium]